MGNGYSVQGPRPKLSPENHFYLVLRSGRTGETQTVAGAKSIFFENDGDGPPKVTWTQNLSSHHVSDVSRGGCLVQAGDVVFAGVDQAAF